MIQGKENKGSDLIDVLKQVFENEKLTGVIHSENPDDSINSNVFIKDGQIVYATSTMYRLRFGDLMIKKGIITQKELTGALRLQKENPKQTFIGEILVTMGVISERVIPNLLYHQIEVVIYEILSWKNAKISFEESNIDEHPDYKRPVANVEGKAIYSDLNKLIDTSAFIKVLETNQASLMHIRNLLNDPDAVPKRVMKSYPSQLTFDQRKILRAIDGANSLNDIIILSDLDYFRTYKILFDLAEEKVISIPKVKFADEDIEGSSFTEVENDEPIIYSKNPIEDELIKLSTHHTDLNKTPAAEEKPVPESSEESSLERSVPDSAAKVSSDSMMLKYQQQYFASREEIKQLKFKINDYENSKLVLSEEITIRASRLPYHKKMMLNNALKNILDMVESI